MGKYPTKSPSDIKEEYNKKIAVGLVEQEWTDIIKYLYNEDDSDALCRILKGVNTVASLVDSSSSSSKTPETNDLTSPNSAGKWTSCFPPVFSHYNITVSKSIHVISQH
jgi:hypothetical protein